MVISPPRPIGFRPAASDTARTRRGPAGGGDDVDFRRADLQRLGQLGDVDVLIIGGGVNGAAVLRDLALNGLSAVLVDTADFCHGATSASTRMAHGGLRYLENREFGLVAESTRERNLLLKNAPHVTVALEVVVPMEAWVSGFVGSALRFLGVSTKPSGFSVASLKAALVLYEWLGRVERVLPAHSIRFGRAGRPTGLAPRYKAVVSYFDGRITNPEGLVFEMIEEAVGAGASVVALNHVDWRRRGRDFEIVDPESGLGGTVRPRLVINAAGAWVDRVNADLGLTTAHVRPVKGAHIVIRNDALLERLAGRAFYFDDGRGRMVICCPMERTVLMGTTEIPSPDPDDDQVALHEVEYLRRAIDGLFTDISVSPDQIVHCTTGMRPLRNSGAGDAYRANRDHALLLDVPGEDAPAVLSLVGGKWTTFRSFAEEAGNLVLARLGRTRSTSTRNRPYPGKAALEGSVIPGSREAILRARYGAMATAAAAFCREGDDRPLAALADFTEREIRWLVTARAARKLDDLVLRRTRIALDGQARPAVLREVAAILAETIGRDEAWAEREVATYLARYGDVGHGLVASRGESP